MNAYYVMPAQKHRQSGLSLVEIMVGLALGLLVTAGLLQIFLGSKDTYRAQDALSRQQENARVAEFFLTRHIRMAGVQDTDATGKLKPNGTALAPAIDNANTLNNTSPTPDQIAIRYKPLADAGGVRRDCAGNVVTGLTAMTFSIANNAAGIPSLHCNGVELVEGVQDMQILYGLDTDSDKVANRYVTFADVTNPSNVVSVRFTLALIDTVSTANPAPIRTLATTIAVRNRVL